MPRTGKLVLLGSYDSHMLFFPRTEEERKKSVKQFSWSGEDYRQNVVSSSAEDAVAKPEDFLPFYFRHLSSTIVGAYSWKATEFTDAVLKKAASMLSKKPVYVNHELEVGNIVGVNGDIKFVPASKSKDGTVIPGGLEGAIWIDAKLHTDLCRKLTAFPVPHIQSVSVTVSYNWEPSHEFKNREGEVDDWEFEYQIGNIVEGKMVRRIVTEIVDFYETSLVYLGADPFAKILDENGKPINVEKSAVVGTKEFKKDPLVELYKKANVMYVKDDGLETKNVLHLRESIVSGFSKTGKLPEGKTQTEKETNMEKALAQALAKKLGKTEEEITPEMLEGYSIVKKEELTSLNAEKQAREKADGELATAKVTLEKFEAICKADELEAFGKEVAPGEVRSMAKLGAEVVKAKREEVVRLYKLSVGEGKEDAAVIGTLEKAEGAALDGFLKQYGSSVTEQFGGKCEACGSEKISYRKSEPEGGEGGKASLETESMAERLRF